MEAKDLIFYNKEGYQLNLKTEPTIGYKYGSMYFDKNSTDTFKTLGIYTFEKLEPTNYTFQSYLDTYQQFNYNDIISRKQNISNPILIEDIKLSNNDASFSSRWIYSENIEKYFKKGDWCYFSNLDSNYSELSTYLGIYLNIFQVILCEPGRILITLSNINSNNIPITTYSTTFNGLLYPLNVVEYNTTLPINVTQYSLKTYIGKKIQIISENTKNDDILTIKHITNSYSKSINTYNSTLFVPNNGDKIKIDFTFYTDRIQICNGLIEFAPGNTPILGVDSIKVSYIPKFLKVGDTIIAQEKNTPLLGPNTATLTVVYIDKINNIIEVSSILSNQIEDCYLYLASNIFTIEQDIIKDNNNTYSLPVTYWSIVQQYNDFLNDFGITLFYDTLLNTLNIQSNYINYGNTPYFSSILKRYDNTNTLINTLTPTLSFLAVLPHIVEKLNFNEIITKDSSLYKRFIHFTFVDNSGINIIINNKLYDIDFNTDAVTTLNDWIVQYTSILNAIGILVYTTTTILPNDTLEISTDFENVPIIVELQMGDFSVYEIKDSIYEFHDIKNELLININGIEYRQPFITDDITTVNTWVNTYKAILKSRRIIVSNTGTNTLINFNKLDSNNILNISYNIGFSSLSGDDSIIITQLANENAGSLIYSGELKIISGTYNLLDFYGSGQKITLHNTLFTKNQINNSSYNILDLTDDTIWLSYQGTFWNQGTNLSLLDINITSDFFIRYPRQGISTSDNRSKLRWSWKDTQTDELFLYDLSGSQLKPIYTSFPNYNGPIPLCGLDGTINVPLNKLPNDKIEYISDPSKQQTVFDLLEYNILFNDEEQDPNQLISPMQIFIGYNQIIESWIKARLYLELIEDISFTKTTTYIGPGNITDQFSFYNDTLEVINPSINFDFSQLGFKPGQLIEISSVDANIDGKKLAILENNGKKIRIKSVQHHKLTFTTNDLITEFSYKSVPTNTVPFYDNLGNAIFVDRYLSVTLTVLPNLLAYFDIYGESEGEDERHLINLNNRNLNILQLKDFFIFKTVDINEDGIDWVLFNRKRKQLLEIYPEIFNHVSSYKSIIQAINFFGYNDLTFTEYMQNVNTDSHKFGQLFNMELINIFDKSIKGWSYSNISLDNLKNNGYKKTNLFSLNYRITDKDGNFIDAYSQNEVQIKLNGLKRWLTENLIPIGAKITDINGKYTQPINWFIKHDTYKNENKRVEEYSAPIDFDVTGYLYPITLGSDNYNISVTPKCQDVVEWYDYKVRTFNIIEWNNTYFYLAGTKLIHNNKIWESLIAVSVGDEPGVTSNWIETTLDNISNIQIFTDCKYDLTPWSFSINKITDPHFMIEVNYHSGYGCTWQTKKVYSVIPNFFSIFNNI